MACDPHAAEFFQKQMQGPENSVCCDYGTKQSTWASISHGIYLSIEAAGIHRSLGVKTSFVQSTTMDSWKPKHIRMMELGGNQRFNQFLAEHGVPTDMPIRDKYRTRAAQWYRKNLSALADGLEPPAPLPVGTGHLLDSIPSSSMEHILDRVFVDSTVPPHTGSIASADAKQTESPEDDLPEVKPTSMCQRLASCFKLSVYSAPAAEEAECHAFVDSSPASLPVLLGSTVKRPSTKVDHERLKKMSTGKMEGFGATDASFDRLQKMPTGKKEGFGSTDAPLK